MSDNLRRYRAIREALTQCYPGEPKGNMARHLNTLAGFISGICGQQEQPTAHDRDQNSRWGQARESRQTTNSVAEERRD